MTPATSRSMFAVAVVLAGAALAGCSATPPVDATSAPVEASASASPEPAAEPAPATSDPTCDTVLTEEAIARLEADGLEQIDVGASTFYPIADDLIEAGGLACKWGRPSSDATLTVVQLSGIDVASSEWPAALAAAGYAETGDPVPGAHSGPTDPGTGVPSVVVVETDRLTFVSTPLHAIDVAVD